MPQKIIRFTSAFYTLLIILTGSTSLADEVYLKNGDRVSGQILSETDTDLTIKSDFLGTIPIEKSNIKRIAKGLAETESAEIKEDKPKEKLWHNEISLGYAEASGNTESQSGSGKLLLHRKTDDNEFHFKTEGYYKSSDDKVNTSKYYGLIRYAYSFSGRKWYNFYKVEGNRDRFANIDYRIVPSTGIGYWFSDREPFKAMVEGAVGYQHTKFRDGSGTSDEAILVPRAFMEAKLWGHLIVSEDITLYPSLTEVGDFRLNSKTDLTSPINDKLAMRLSFIDEFNSNPPSATKKNDFRIISSLVYSF